VESLGQVQRLNLDGVGPKAGPQTVTLYHGSQHREVVPTYGMCEDKHDYGRGFYLTPDIELAKEWAAGNADKQECWLHTFSLDLSELKVFDFESIKKDRGLYWAAEILRHRRPQKSEEFKRSYRDYSSWLNNKYGVDLCGYDVVCGWRADDSYFRIVEALIGNELVVDLLEKALRLGDLGLQYCLKTKKAYGSLTVVKHPERVPYNIYFS